MLKVNNIITEARIGYWDITEPTIEPRKIFSVFIKDMKNSFLSPEEYKNGIFKYGFENRKNYFISPSSIAYVEFR